MSSREEILSTIRSKQIEPTERPSLDGPWTQYDDPVQKLIEVVDAIGGKALLVSNLSEVGVELEKLPAFVASEKITSRIGSVTATVDLDSIDDQHLLTDLDFAVLPGQFGVAENGAIWVTDEDLPHRAVYFAAQHLSLVISAGDIVSNMFQAYARLSFSGPSFGMFKSGPSKTADIEQSLVIGAQGVRSLTVFIIR